MINEYLYGTKKMFPAANEKNVRIQRIIY